MDEIKTIGVILAGGESERMGGKDKGEVMLDGQRLVDRVYHRLKQQVSTVIVSGRHNYGLDVDFVVDDKEGPGGPVGGICAVTKWLRQQDAKCDGFLSCPVDGPFLPTDLGERMINTKRSMMAKTAQDPHPTFAYWRLDGVETGLASLEGQASISLRALASAAGGGFVEFEDKHLFFNVNNAADLSAATQYLAKASAHQQSC